MIDPKTKKLVDEPYKLYDIALVDTKKGREIIPSYGTYLFQAVEAKGAVGLATNDGWVFAMILEAYENYAKRNDYQYSPPNEPEKKIPMISLTRAKFFKYHFAYIRGLQDFVVTGIKHNDNGSGNFEMLFLKNIAQEANSKKVRELLLGPLQLDEKSVSDIVRITSWASITGVYEACAAFLKLYNKGTHPNETVKEWLDLHQKFIQKDTYFGMLLEPIYNVIYQYEHHEEIAREQTKQSFEELMKQIESMP